MHTCSGFMRTGLRARGPGLRAGGRGLRAGDRSHGCMLRGIPTLPTGTASGVSHNRRGNAFVRLGAVRASPMRPLHTRTPGACGTNAGTCIPGGSQVLNLRGSFVTAIRWKSLQLFLFGLALAN